MDDQQRNRNRGTFNDCNSSTFNMVIGQSDLYGNIKPHDVDISHTRNALAYKLSMTVSGQKSKNAFDMELNAVSSDKPPMLNYTVNNRVTCAPRKPARASRATRVMKTKRKKDTICKSIAISYTMPSI